MIALDHQRLAAVHDRDVDRRGVLRVRRLDDRAVEPDPNGVAIPIGSFELLPAEQV